MGKIHFSHDSPNVGGPFNVHLFSTCNWLKKSHNMSRFKGVFNDNLWKLWNFDVNLITKYNEQLLFPLLLMSNKVEELEIFGSLVDA